MVVSRERTLGRISGRCGLNRERVIVRVLISSERRNETERELTQYSGVRPFRQGTDPSLLWDFSSRENADLFAANAMATVGVTSVKID